MAVRNGLVIMRSMLIIIIKNFKNKKLQNVLISIVLVLSTVIFAAALCTLGNMSDPFQMMFHEHNASHFVIQFDKRLYEPDAIKKWWNDNNNTRNVTEVTQLSGNYKVKVNEEELADQIFFAQITKNNQDIDTISSVEGNAEFSLESFEALLPTSFANAYGLKKGDSFEISTDKGTFAIKISEIVVDPYYSSNFIHPTRVWVKEETMKLMFHEEDINLVSLGVKLNNLEELDSDWKRFEDMLDGSFVGYKLTYETIRYSYLVLSQIICGIMIAFSLIVIAVALYIIYLTISNSIILEYQNIGVYKSQGFTNQNIVGVYMLQYVALAIISFIIGIFISTFLTHILLESFTKSMGIMNIEPGGIILFSLITVLIELIIVVFAVYLSAHSAGKIKPAQAIRYGAPEKEYSKIKLISIQKLCSIPLSMALGIKQMFANRRQSILFVAIFSVTAFVLMFSLNSVTSVQKMGSDLPIWGYDASDIYVEIVNRDVDVGKLNQVLNENNDVDYVIKTGMFTSGTIPADEHNQSTSVLGTVVAGDMNKLGMINLEGENPVATNEISLAVNTARQYSASVGDDIKIILDGKEHSFKITGIYQSMAEMGQGYRITESGLKEATEDYQLNKYGVFLKDKSPESIESYMDEFKSIVGEGVSVYTPEESLGQSFNMIIQYVTLGIGILSAIFLIVLAVIIVNTMLLDIQQEKKMYGILKTCGMLPSELRMSLAWRIVITSVIGLIIGIPVGMVAAPGILNLAMSSMGIVNYPVVINFIDAIYVILIIIAISLLCSWLTSRKVLDTNPKLLLIE